MSFECCLKLSWKPQQNLCIVSLGTKLLVAQGSLKNGFNNFQTSSVRLNINRKVIYLKLFGSKAYLSFGSILRMKVSLEDKMIIFPRTCNIFILTSQYGYCKGEKIQQREL